MFFPTLFRYEPTAFAVDFAIFFTFFLSIFFLPFLDFLDFEDDAELDFFHPLFVVLTVLEEEPDLIITFPLVL